MKMHPDFYVNQIFYSDMDKIQKNVIKMPEVRIKNAVRKNFSIARPAWTGHSFSLTKNLQLALSASSSKAQGF